MERTSEVDLDLYALDLLQYYRDKGLTIVGLNDSQGINTSPTPFKNSLLEYLALALTSDDLKPEVINAFSLAMNKTEHIDYFLKNNLSVEEIKLSQIYSAISALEKVMESARLPRFLAQVGNIYRLVYSPKLGDEKIKIASTLKRAVEPVVIYSSGTNNLMREVGSNPFVIKKDYALRDQTPNYYYTLRKIDDPVTLIGVLDSIKRNFDNILGINEKTDIYALSGYIPQSLCGEEMIVFRNFILMYNEQLHDLCNQYGITFVDTMSAEKKYNHSGFNYHISTAKHNALANNIIELMHENKFGPIDNRIVRTTSIPKCEILNDGALGVLRDTLEDYGESCDRATYLSGYDAIRAKEIVEEHERESRIFMKVLTKTSK